CTGAAFLALRGEIPGKSCKTAAFPHFERSLRLAVEELLYFCSNPIFRNLVSIKLLHSCRIGRAR
ncbi:hypothetical protein, partial [Paenibacillus dendritiformis]|uniref:hypothetical protein n=1 Tax=Paenibacillus dendritiformis TaxID=130049 RepID=UPI001C278312